MGQIKITYRQSNTFTVPPGVTNVFVECLGGGGAGGKGGALAAGGGGGGGAYAASNLSLTPGNSYAVNVGAQTVNTTSGAGVKGNQSSFGSSLVVADSGSGGGAPSGLGGLTPGSGGAGGSASNSTGQTRTSGSNGANGGNGGAGAPPLAEAGPNFYGNGGNGGAAVSQGNGVAGFQGLVVVSFDYVSDSVGSSDNISYIVDWKRSFNESASSSDQLFKRILSSKSDSFSASDFISKSEILYKSDLVTPNDELAKAYHQFDNDAASLDDFALVVLVYIRTAADVAETVDVVSKNTSMSKSDIYSAVDWVSNYFKTSKSDSVDTSDNFVLESLYRRLFSSAVSTTDSLYKTIGIGVDDSISGAVYVPPVSSGRKRIIVLSD